MPNIMVKLVLSDLQAAKLQDFGAGLKVSLEDVIAAAVKVGFNDWSAVEGELIVNSTHRMSPDDRQMPIDRRHCYATLDLDADQASLVDETAAWCDRELSDFLADCLQSGIAHAQAAMMAADEAALASPYDGKIPF